MRSRRIVPVILSGGSGTRLWPLSRELNPKQFHRLSDRNFSLFQETLRRLNDPDLYAPPIIVSNEAHRFVVGAQMQDVGIAAKALVLEPSARGTAAAIAAAASLPQIEADDLILVVPTDHFVGDAAAFNLAVKDASQLAAAGHIVAFGLPPVRPEPNYGYIRTGGAILDGGNGFNISAFVEKPGRTRAQDLIADGRHVWNMGIFLFSKSGMLKELSRHAPQIREAAGKAVDRATWDSDFCRLDAAAFAECPSTSIDYAVMEKTSAGAVYHLDVPWSDLGAWDALWESRRELEGSDAGTVSIGDVHTVDVENSYIRSDGGLVAAIGVSGLVVVASGDAVLVAAMDRAKDVGKLVEGLKANGRREARNHLLVHRPWGHFLTLAEGPGYQVKILTLDPGAQISLQFHRQRSERWVVVEGEAEVLIEGHTRRLGPHQSIEIGKGQKHRLCNPGATPLKVIEVQSGSYLGEDDIVRLDETLKYR